MIVTLTQSVKQKTIKLRFHYNTWTTCYDSATTTKLRRLCFYTATVRHRYDYATIRYNAATILLRHVGYDSATTKLRFRYDFATTRLRYR